MATTKNPPPSTAPAGNAEREVIRKFSPVDGRLLGEFPITTPAEVDEAVARARAAAPAWAATPVRERLRQLAGIKRVIRERGEEFARRISDDTGKPLVDSLVTELMSVPLYFEYYERTAPAVLGRKKLPHSPLFPGKRSYTEHFPMGVVAVISPWNFPFQLAVVPVLSALIAGNAVVLKPSEVTPITGEVIREVFEAAGLPRDIVQVIQGDGSTGAALTRADVDKIFFTGSLATGRKVMAAAAEKPIPVELELGGKDAMIVCEDANLERAARGAVWGGLMNCGQMCVSVERVLVHAAVHDRFVELVRAEVERLRLGGPDEDADMGPMTFPGQLQVVERHVEDARAAGATILTGGRRRDGAGQFWEPTVLTDITPSMAIYRDETFGPVLPILKVHSDEEALRLANDHIYGLNGSVWTSDMDRGLRLASQLVCGQVTVNDVTVSVGNPALPFGGVKSSGFGRYHGPEGLLAFSHQKAIMVDRGFLGTEPFWFPYRGKYPMMRDVFHRLLGGNLPGAVVSLVRAAIHGRKQAGKG